MGNDKPGSLKNILYIIIAVIILLSIYRGVAVKKIGIPGVLEIEFGEPGPLLATTQVIASVSSETPLPSPILPSNTPVPPTSAPHPTATPAPRIYNFSICPNPCNGRNASRGYPERTTKIYSQWAYENIPVGSHFVRAWTMDGREWVRYDCIWPGPESGMSAIELREPEGMHSGTWEVTISVDGEVLLREQISVEGNWSYWSPAGVINQCFETAPD